MAEGLGPRLDRSSPLPDPIPARKVALLRSPGVAHAGLDTLGLADAARYHAERLGASLRIASEERSLGDFMLPTNVAHGLVIMAAVTGSASPITASQKRHS